MRVHRCQRRDKFAVLTLSSIATSQFSHRACASRHRNWVLDKVGENPVEGRSRPASSENRSNAELALHPEPGAALLPAFSCDLLRVARLHLARLAPSRPQWPRAPPTPSRGSC